MNRKMIIFTILSLSIILFGIVMTTIGIVNLSTIVVKKDIHSDYLSENQKLIIYLPPGYDLGFFDRYPVLYMLEGERYFLESKEENKTQWSMKKTLDRLIKEGTLDKMIVVGIYSTDSRASDYTPSFVAELQAGGELEQFTLFLKEEVKPLIDRNYRTLPEVEYTGIAGSSLGGLASLYIGANHADTFSRVGAMSPSLWWNDYEVLDYVATKPTEEKQNRLYLDAGHSIDNTDGHSVTNQQHLQDIEELKDILVARSLFSDIEFYAQLPQETELDPDQALDQRLDRMLQFLFKTKEGNRK